MADQTFTVTESVKAGILDMAAHANKLNGNAAGTDWFYIPNDGKVVLYVDGITGDTFTFTAVADKFGRVETLAPVVAAGKNAVIGPFNPDIWNQSNGAVQFKPTAANAGDIMLAVRVGTPT